jgi:hypothetical protein
MHIAAVARFTFGAGSVGPCENDIKMLMGAHADVISHSSNVPPHRVFRNRNNDLSKKSSAPMLLSHGEVRVVTCF